MQAVGGALYVLRCPVSSVLLEGHPDIASCAKAADEKAEADRAKAEAERVAATAEAAARADGGAEAAPPQGGDVDASEESDANRRPALPPAPVQAQRAVRLKGGQVIRCAKLAGNGPHLNGFLAATEQAQPPQQRWVSRGVCVLDGPVAGDNRQQALLVVPPGPLCKRAVLAMQLGPSSAVVPAVRTLQSSHQHLWPTCPSAAVTRIICVQA